METRDSTTPVAPKANKAAKSKGTHKAPKVARAKVRKDWDLDDALVRVNQAFGETFKKLAR